MNVQQHDVRLVERVEFEGLFSMSREATHPIGGQQRKQLFQPQLGRHLVFHQQHVHGVSRGMASSTV